LFLPTTGYSESINVIAFPIMIVYPIITALLGGLMNKQLENWRNRNVKDRLYESEQRYTNMMLDINMIFVNIDLHRKIVFCNKYFLSITGYTKEELIEKNTVDIFIPVDEKGSTEDAIEELLK